MAISNFSSGDPLDAARLNEIVDKVNETTQGVGWVRFGDLQICWGGQDLSTASSSTRSFGFTFPQPFIETPRITNSINCDSSGYMFSVYSYDLTITEYKGNIFENYSGRTTTAPVRMDYVAIGKWR